MSRPRTNSYLLNSGRNFETNYTSPFKNSIINKENKVIDNKEYQNGVYNNNLLNPLTTSANIINDFQNITIKSNKLDKSDKFIQNEYAQSDTTLIESKQFESVKDYFQLKIRAIKSITFNRFNDKEKEFIRQKIKKHQDKRLNLKNQYESIFTESVLTPIKIEIKPKILPELLQSVNFFKCLIFLVFRMY